GEGAAEGDPDRSVVGRPLRGPRRYRGQADAELVRVERLAEMERHPGGARVAHSDRRLEGGRRRDRGGPRPGVADGVREYRPAAMEVPGDRGVLEVLRVPARLLTERRAEAVDHLSEEVAHLGLRDLEVDGEGEARDRLELDVLHTELEHRRPVP